MPTYEYECRKCGLRFDKFQQMSDARLRKCPECGGKVERLIGAGGAVIVKGSGSRGYGESQPSCCRDQPCCGKDISRDAWPCNRQA